MTGVDPPRTGGAAETERGRALFAELLWVHRVIRRDLEALRKLASGVRSGLAAEDLRSELQQLQTKGPLWRLRGDCLRYCHLVHSHHHAEDVLLFPTLRGMNSSLGPIVGRLEADHRKVSGLLDSVEAAALTLTDDDGFENQTRISGDLGGAALFHQGRCGTARPPPVDVKTPTRRGREGPESRRNTYRCGWYG
jgi:hypothetical protein